MPFLDIFGGYVSSLEDVYLLAQKKMVSNRDVEYIDSIDEKKSPLWLHNRGGICYPSASSQGPPCDLEVRKPMKLPGICGPISVGCFDIPTPKKNGPESLGFLVVPKKNVYKTLASNPSIH